MLSIEDTEVRRKIQEYPTGIFPAERRWKRKESKGERLAWTIPTLDRNVRIHAEECAGASARPARRAKTYKRGSVKRSTSNWSGWISRKLTDKDGKCTSSAVVPDILGTYRVLT